MKAPGFKRWFARLPALNGPQRAGQAGVHRNTAFR